MEMILLHLLLQEWVTNTQENSQSKKDKRASFSLRGEKNQLVCAAVIFMNCNRLLLQGLRHCCPGGTCGV